MKEDRRAVALFVAVGLLSAGVIGVVTWLVNMPSPAPHAAGQLPVTVTSAASTAEEIAPSKSSSPTLTSEPARSEKSEKQRSRDAVSALAQGDGSWSSTPTQKFASPKTNDPFLAPNAVEDPAQAPGPTGVFRPENLADAPPAPSQRPSRPAFGDSSTSSATTPTLPETSLGEPTPEATTDPEPTEEPTSTDPSETATSEKPEPETTTPLNRSDEDLAGPGEQPQVPEERSAPRSKDPEPQESEDQPKPEQTSNSDSRPSETASTTTPTP